MNKIGCPFKVLSGIECSWTGSPSEVMNHVMSSHIYETQEKLGPFAMQLQNFSKYKNFHTAIFTLDKLFYLLWVIKEDIIHFLVFVIPKTTSEDYTYQTSEEYVYNFKLQKGEEQIAVTGGACGSFAHHKSKVLETGDIVRLHRSTVQNFVDENGELSCVIEIRGKEATLSSSKVCDTSDMEEELFYTDELYEVEMESSEEETEPTPDMAKEPQCPVPAK
jgi:hypothetical protein